MRKQHVRLLSKQRMCHIVTWRLSLALETTVPLGYVLFVILRRIIIALCLVSLLPTAIDPSCVRYFIYSDLALPTGNPTCDSVSDAGPDKKGMLAANRPVEVLAASRIPSHIHAIAPVLLRLSSQSYFDAPEARTSFASDLASDRLAPSQRESYLRHSALLI